MVIEEVFTLPICPLFDPVYIVFNLFFTNGDMLLTYELSDGDVVLTLKEKDAVNLNVLRFTTVEQCNLYLARYRVLIDL